MLTKMKKIKFLKKCIEWNNDRYFSDGFGICSIWDWENCIGEMEEGFPELYEEIRKRQRRRLSAYAWSLREERIAFLDKFIKEINKQ